MAKRTHSLTQLRDAMSTAASATEPEKALCASLGVSKLTGARVTASPAFQGLMSSLKTSD